MKCVIFQLNYSYNAIVGWPTLNSLNLVTSTCHIKMKFSIEKGIRVVCGEQLVARECYVQELRGKERI